MARQKRPGARVGSPEWRERLSRGHRRANEQRRERGVGVMPDDIKRFRRKGAIAPSLRALCEQSSRELEAWLHDLGGEAELSAMERSVLENAARVDVIVRAEMARFLAAEPGSKTGLEAAAAVRASVATQVKLLESLGLGRRARPVDVTDVVRAIEARANGANGSERPREDPSTIHNPVS